MILSSSIKKSGQICAHIVILTFLFRALKLPVHLLKFLFCFYIFLNQVLILLFVTLILKPAFREFNAGRPKFDDSSRVLSYLITKLVELVLHRNVIVTILLVHLFIVLKNWLLKLGPVLCENLLETRKVKTRSWGYIFLLLQFLQEKRKIIYLVLIQAHSLTVQLPLQCCRIVEFLHLARGDLKFFFFVRLFTTAPTVVGFSTIFVEPSLHAFQKRRRIRPLSFYLGKSMHIAEMPSIKTVVVRDDLVRTCEYHKRGKGEKSHTVLFFVENLLL